MCRAKHGEGQTPDTLPTASKGVKAMYVGAMVQREGKLAPNTIRDNSKNVCGMDTHTSPDMGAPFSPHYYTNRGERWITGRHHTCTASSAIAVYGLSLPSYGLPLPT